MFWLTLACGPEKNQFESEKSALQAFEEFELQREQGNWGEAQIALNKAIRHQPDMRNLRDWEIYLYYQKGEYGECSDKARQYLEIMPGEGNMRYNLAACLAKEGRLDEAAQHLKILILDGRVHPIEVAEDRDFELMIDDPNYTDIVQKPELAAGIITAPKSMLLGDTETIRIQVRYRSTDTLQFGDNSGNGLRILKITQTNMDSDDHMAMCQIDLQIEATKVGEVVVDNLEVKTATQSVKLSPIVIEAIDLKSTTPTETASVKAFMPAKWLLRQTPPYTERIPYGSKELIVVSAPPNAEINHTGETLQAIELWEDKKMKAKGLVIFPANTTEIEVKFEEKILYGERFVNP